MLLSQAILADGDLGRHLGTLLKHQKRDNKTTFKIVFPAPGSDFNISVRQQSCWLNVRNVSLF